jgi:nicotinamide-nucleotide amidase
VNPAEQAVAAVAAAGVRVSVAESLTGGMVSSLITDVPGSSAVFPGSVVSYSVGAKAQVLGVSAQLLTDSGPVHLTVARQMAQGVARLFAAEIAVATTGVAGPEAHGGFPPGVVVIGWFAQGETGAVAGQFLGDRHEIRVRTADAALAAITQCAVYGRVRDELVPPSGYFPVRE